MTMDARKFNQALAEFQAFGPRRRIPIEDRWRELLPDIEPAAFDELEERCRNIEAFALGLAEQASNQKLSQEVARKQIEEKFPYLTPDSVSHTWSQAMYYSMK